MGHRLSRIATRTGDTGQAGLADGSRVPKSGVRIDALGEVDELNCYVGIVLTHELPPAVRTFLARLQHQLFDLGGELAIPTSQVISEAHVTALDDVLAEFNKDLPPLVEFVLPGGNPAAANAHLARAVARRAERAFWALSTQEPESVNLQAGRFLNRLSDVLFVCSRLLAREEGGAEVTWRRTPAE
jgi:cob(I)alamin adenosyltransferase